MISFKNNLFKIFATSLFSIFFIVNNANSNEKKIEAIGDQIQIIIDDLKTLEKAVYKGSDITVSSSTDGLNEDILTKHLLKLNEIENQFQDLTNRFEEINFKIDKLSNRVSKIQSDSQLRFSDLESKSSGTLNTNGKTEKKINLPGSDKPQDFGAAPGYDVSNLPSRQETQSIQSAGTVVTEEAEKISSLLPNKPPLEQYEFAVSFMKIGDYETAEFALKEFINKNKEHELAGSAQYWYGETFRIRQLYSDAASAYLDGYQNYPKSKKAPDNLLKLGITMVQLGEKDQGCSMIVGIKKQYPKASKSVLQKAQYEQKKFKCAKS
ncbi:MAG: tol-pal system protein YbgF [Pelagibacteraceae bacterium]